MKTIIKTTLIAVAILIGITANAQDKPLTFGVKAGIDLHNIGGDADGTDAKIGFTGGVTLDFAFTPDLYLMTGLDFSMKGAKIGEGFDEDAGKVDVKLNLSYLQLPVHIGYKLAVGETTKINFHAGPYIAYGISGKWKGSASGISASIDAFGDESTAAELPKLKKFDFGLGLGVGVEFGKIGAGIGYDFGLTNIHDGNVGKIRNMNGYLTVGYKF